MEGTTLDGRAQTQEVLRGLALKKNPTPLEVLAHEMRLRNYSPKTTEIYTHISQKRMSHVQSPLDKILRTKEDGV